jgi:hypothetical protein
MVQLHCQNPVFPKCNSLKKYVCQWLMPVIPVTQEAKIRQIAVWSQPGQIVWEILSWKNPSEKRACQVALGVGPDFKHQYCNNNNNNNRYVCALKKSCWSASSGKSACLANCMPLSSNPISAKKRKKNVFYLLKI